MYNKVANETATHYTWCGYFIFEYVKGKFIKKHRGKKKQGWDEGDVIEIIVNCEKWEISFYKNDQLYVGGISIQPKLTYYFMIGFGKNVNHQGKYQIVL